jgi:hypothetical protein
LVHRGEPTLRADIVAKVLESQRESKFVQYATLDRRFVESKMRVDGRIWNIFSRTDAENLFATLSASNGLMHCKKVAERALAEHCFAFPGARKTCNLVRELPAGRAEVPQ